MRFTEFKNECGMKMKEKIINTLKQKKVINIIIIIAFIALLIGTSYIRLQNLPLLIDHTTGQYIPLALDPHYFLRIAETMLEGPLPEIDVMRYPAMQVGFTNEILPLVTVLMYKTVNVFDKDITMQFINVISPVVFFVLGMITFFFLIFVLTKSKSIAFISSFFLAIIPPFLHRTMAGFSDHESIGILAFFLTMLCFATFFKQLDGGKNEK